MTLTPIQTLIIISMVTLGMVITRKITHLSVTLGKFCLKSVNLTIPSLWQPEAVAIVCIILLHSWKRNVLLSIGVGTGIYMVLIQFVFI